MVTDLILAFVIGSSLATFALYFIGVLSLRKEYNIDKYYEKYSLIAPFYLGIFSSFAIALSKCLKISITKSYFITSLIASLSAIIYASKMKVYKFNTLEPKFAPKVILLYLFVYNFIVSPLYQLLYKGIKC